MKRALSTLGAVLVISGCASGSARSISPADIAPLQAHLAANPTDGRAALELAAALASAGDCERAIAVGRQGMELRPQDALGPLVVGQCLESLGDVEAAIAVYEAFGAEYAEALGAPAVEARAMLARRALAAETARVLLAREAEITARDADPNVLAVMPVEIVGDSSYAPLSLGLAAMLTSDLALVSGLRLVERTELSSLLRELELAETGMVDPATAARAGRLLRAGTVIHGLTLVAPDERFRLEASLMNPDSRILGTEAVAGGLRQLLRLEKDLALALVERLGYPLSQAERNAILENGTQDLVAFLAYSQGLLVEELGNYGAAAEHFGRAVRADPGFSQARSQHRVSTGATLVQSAAPGDLARVASTRTSSPLAPTASESLSSALSASVQEVSPTLADAVSPQTQAQGAVSTSTASPPPSMTGILAQIVTFGFRLVLVFP